MTSIRHFLDIDQFDKATLRSILKSAADMKSGAVDGSAVAAGKGCGARLLGGSRDSAVLEIPLNPASGLREGDEVRLTLEPSHLLRATMLVYGLPLAGIILSLTAGWLLSRPLSDAAAIVYATGGLAAGLFAGRRQLGRHECLTQFIPRIEGKVDAVSDLH